jgi:hypothetical protein
MARALLETRAQTSEPPRNIASPPPAAESHPLRLGGWIRNPILQSFDQYQAIFRFDCKSARNLQPLKRITQARPLLHPASKQLRAWVATNLPSKSLELDHK